MTPIVLHTLIYSSTGDPKTIQETVFSRTSDLMAVPRIGETVLINNYLLEVADVMHSPLSPVKVFTSFLLNDDAIPDEDQLKMVAHALTAQGWTIEDSITRLRDDDEIEKPDYRLN